jgi:hypothetical protein
VNKRMLSRPLGRCIGLDVHLDFIEIGICEVARNPTKIPSNGRSGHRDFQALLTDWG